VPVVRTDVLEECSTSTISIIFLHSVRRLLITANVPSSPILISLMMEVLHSSETSVLIRATWRNIPEDGILHSHCRETSNLSEVAWFSLYTNVMF
jgi:hypothetical protein